MIFTSDVYVVFLLAVFVLYWLAPPPARKVLLILASYVFYASWSWRYLALLWGVSLFNWAYARWAVARASRTSVLLAGILVNAGVLGYFKYTGFFLDNLHASATMLGVRWSPPAVHILLPLGVSFFTFQGIAYLVDVASGDRPILPLGDFLLFKALWPQLIAGPITRVDEMRGQIAGRRSLADADWVGGARRVLIGFNKKLVLADTLAPAVEKVFASGAAPTGVDAVLGTVGFGLQIYFDFSAYSDIAIGSARLFGFVLPENFAWPYGAASPQEFWNRWHMTLSRWIRDYLFAPLSFTFRRSPGMEHVGLIVAMTLCGLWHGANWTFVLWGLWHGLLLVLNRTLLQRAFARATGAARAVGVAATFVLVSVGWVLFRASSVRQALSLLGAIASLRGGLALHALNRFEAALIVAVLAALAAADLSRRRAAGLARAVLAHPWLRPAAPFGDVVLLHLAVIFGGVAKPFVYFQF